MLNGRMTIVRRILTPALPVLPAHGLKPIDRCETSLWSPKQGAGSRLEAKTGTHCPRSGTWAADRGEQSVVVWVPEGQLMPPATGTPARWIYKDDQASRMKPSLPAPDGSANTQKVSD